MFGLCLEKLNFCEGDPNKGERRGAIELKSETHVPVFSRGERGITCVIPKAGNLQRKTGTLFQIVRFDQRGCQGLLSSNTTDVTTIPRSSAFALALSAFMALM